MTKAGKRKVKAGPRSQGTVLAVAEKDHFSGRALSHGSLDLLDGLDLAIDRDDVKVLTKSQFGGIVRMGSRNKFAAQLVHFWLLWQLKTRKQHETWYSIQGHHVRFSLHEFALITGLNCAPPPRDVMEGDHKDAIYQLFKKEKVSLKDLERAWEHEKQTDSGSLMKKYKLALLVIVEGILFGLEKKTQIRGWVVKLLLEDTTRFLEFPWGRLVYERLHESLAGTLKDLVAAKAHLKDKTTYALYGFPMAFQLWVYETFPEIGNHFGRNIDDIIIPRCLRWETPNSHIRYENVKSFLSLDAPANDPIDEHVLLATPEPILHPTHKEKDAYPHSSYKKDAPDVFFDQIVGDQMRARRDKRRGEDATAGPSQATSQSGSDASSVGLEARIVAKVEALLKGMMVEMGTRFRELEEKVTEVSRECKQVLSERTGKGKDPVDVFDDDVVEKVVERDLDKVVADVVDKAEKVEERAEENEEMTADDQGSVKQGQNVEDNTAEKMCWSDRF